MGRKGKRKRIGRGLYQDGTGRSAVCLGREKRFPPGTPHQEMQDWQDSIRKRYRGSGQAQSARGTLADAVNRWDGQETHLVSYRARRCELRAWVRLYGPLRLSAITAEHVRRAISAWTSDGVSPKTIRNRLWTLKHLYRLTIGPDTLTPADHVKPPAKVRHVITPVSADVILKVYRKLVRWEQTKRLPDAKLRARYMVRAATGRRPSEVMRTQPDDLNLEQRTWRVRDGKGGWSEGLYLNDDMLKAWQTFIAADAWGDFDTWEMAEVLYAAGWPKGIKPYNLRHSVGIDISERGIDLADVGGWLGHKDVRTTRAAYVPLLSGRMQKIAQVLDGRLRGWR
jgi:site-specific recombinase XerD